MTISYDLPDEVLDELQDVTGLTEHELRTQHGVAWEEIETGLRRLEILASDLNCEVGITIDRTETAAATPWRGDLADDCSLLAGDLFAHAEAMSCGSWYCSVTRQDSECQGHGRGGSCTCEQIYHSLEDGRSFRTGVQARRFCEGVIAAISGAGR